jgi:hypothetical protein
MKEFTRLQFNPDHCRAELTPIFQRGMSPDAGFPEQFLQNRPYHTVTD